MGKGIKKIIFSNNSNHIFPAAVTVNNETITNPSDIANGFNNYFAKVVVDIQSSIRFSKNKYFDYFMHLIVGSFFVTPTDSTEVSNIISLNQDKSDGPNSIPIKIQKLLNKDISDQLLIFFNQYFSPGIFSSILKTSQIIPIYKKGFKLECSNRRISFLSNNDKIPERLIYNRLYNFLDKKEIIFSIIFFHSCSDSSHRYEIEIDKGNMLAESL